MSTLATKPLTAFLFVDQEFCLRIPLDARYDAADPYAVHFDFTAAQNADEAHGIHQAPDSHDPNLAGEACRTWAFGRELLKSGLERPSGDGDVRIWPYGPATVMIELRSGAAAALIAVATRDLRRFLHETYTVVRPGAENTHLDWDQELQHLLGGA